MGRRVEGWYRRRGGGRRKRLVASRRGRGNCACCVVCYLVSVWARSDRPASLAVMIWRRSGRYRCPAHGYAVQTLRDGLRASQDGRQQRAARGSRRFWCRHGGLSLAGGIRKGRRTHMQKASSRLDMYPARTPASWGRRSRGQSEWERALSLGSVGLGAVTTGQARHVSGKIGACGLHVCAGPPRSAIPRRSAIIPRAQPSAEAPLATATRVAATGQQ